MEAMGRCWVWLFLLVPMALVGCGPEAPPPAQFERFTIELMDHEEGDLVVPGQELKYEIHYQGDLSRELHVTALLTDEKTGETEAVPIYTSQEEAFRFDERAFWNFENAFLQRPGRVRVQLEASIRSTKTGSEPWSALSGSVFVQTQPVLDAVEILSPSITPPVPYGTALRIRVTGKDLWQPVKVTVMDLDAQAPVPGVELSLPFDGTQTSLEATWTIRSPALEQIGTHALQLVATYGQVQASSAAFLYEVTHTLDSVEILAVTSEGTIALGTDAARRLPEVSQIGVRIHGTQLPGHPVTINGAAPFTAASNDLDRMLVTPSTDDFDAGVGFRTWTFVVQSGGMERTARITLQRWGITSCAWRTENGAQVPNQTSISRGTMLTMSAEAWGFPDTKDYFLFRSPQAHFKIWERDPGGRPTGDLLLDAPANNDDEVDTLHADIFGNHSETSWTVVYDGELSTEDFTLGIQLNAAEYDFDVEIEDQRCTATEVDVY